MGCRKYQNMLALWIDCLLTETQMESLEKHLTQCPACNREAQLYKKMVVCFEHVKKMEVPDDFYVRLSRRLCQEQPQAEAKPWFWRMPLMVGSLSAAALLLVLLTLPPKTVKYASEPDTLLTSSLPTQSQVEKLSPLLLEKEPAPAGPAASQPKVAARAESEDAKAEKREPAMEAASAPAAPAPASAVMAAQRSLLQAADFSQGGGQALPAGEPVPAYTLPHLASRSRAGNAPTEAKMLNHFKAQIPVPAKPEAGVARNPGQLQALMEKSKQTTPMFTELDWKKQMLASVFFAPDVSPGYKITLDAIVQMPDKIVVQYRLQRPVSVVPSDEGSAPLFVVLPYSDLPVEFAEQ